LWWGGGGEGARAGLILLNIGTGGEFLLMC
jgi:hypothetical protein